MPCWKWIVLSLLMAFHVGLLGQTEKVLFSHHGGFYDEPFALSLGCSDWNSQICFTTNGNTPTANSTLYDAPLFLDESLYSTSNIYTLPIAPYADPFVPEAVRHAIVIRAAAFNDDGGRYSPPEPLRLRRPVQRPRPVRTLRRRSKRRPPRQRPSPLCLLRRR